MPTLFVPRPPEAMRHAAEALLRRGIEKVDTQVAKLAVALGMDVQATQDTPLASEEQP